MSAQLHSAIISAFFNLFSTIAWDKLRETFINHGYKKVYIKPTTFKDKPDIEVKGKIELSDPEILKFFLDKEHKSAMSIQDLELAAEIRKMQNSLNGSETAYEGCVLKFKISQKEKHVCQIAFETNVLSFKNRLIEEYLSASITEKVIDFYEFSHCWNDYIKEKTTSKNFDRLWNDNKEWTKLALNDLKNRLRKEFNLGDNVWSEWRKFDLSIGVKNQFEELSYYNFYGIIDWDGKITADEKYQNLDYPTHQLLLLEHENNFTTALNELIKLTYERALYKVLITYPEKIIHRQSLLTNTLKVLQQSDELLPEYVSEYIVVLGERIGYTLYWSNYQFGCNGVLLNSHFFQSDGKYKSIEELTYKDFENHPVWLDFKTVEFNSDNNSIKMIDAVKPEQDNTIIHLDEVISSVYFSEKYFVACKFFNERFDGYVTITTDYDSKRDGMFEKYIEPTIIHKDTNEHILLTINNKKQAADICMKLKVTQGDLFNFNYEIQANLKGKGFVGKENGSLFGSYE